MHHEFLKNCEFEQMLKFKGNKAFKHDTSMLKVLSESILINRVWISQIIAARIHADVITIPKYKYITLFTSCQFLAFSKETQ